LLSIAAFTPPADSRFDEKYSFIANGALRERPFSMRRRANPPFVMARSRAASADSSGKRLNVRTDACGCGQPALPEPTPLLTLHAPILPRLD
jgi:hypothetical protein